MSVVFRALRLGFESGLGGVAGDSEHQQDGRGINVLDVLQFQNH